MKLIFKNANEAFLRLYEYISIHGIEYANTKCVYDISFVLENPLDISQDRFVSQTIYTIKDIFTNRFKKLLLDGKKIRSKNWDENEFVYFSSRHLMLLNGKGTTEDFTEIYLDDFYDLKTGAENFERI